MSRSSNKAGKASNRAIMPFYQDSAKTGFAGSPPRPLKKSSRCLDPRKNTPSDAPQTIEGNFVLDGNEIEEQVQAELAQRFVEEYDRRVLKLFIGF